MNEKKYLVCERRSVFALLTLSAGMMGAYTFNLRAAALVRYLEDHPHIRKVVLRLDNDLTGKQAAETIKALLPKKYAVDVSVRLSPQGKDYNDCLCMRLGLPITKRKERAKER